MKTITINVSEPVYDSFRLYAEQTQVKASALIREAMVEYQERHILRGGSLRKRRPPISVGGPIEPLGPEDDVLGEMLDAARD
ncbi:MAG: hypothetical protein ACO3N7_02045 [Kiritimatiellia bacterium]